MGKFLSTISAKKTAVTLAITNFFVMTFVVPAYGLSSVTSPVTGSVDTMKGIIDKMISGLFGVAVLIAVVVIVWQGFKMMSGNPSAAQGAKDAIIKTLIGLGVILFAWAIVGAAAGVLLANGQY